MDWTRVLQLKVKVSTRQPGLNFFLNIEKNRFSSVQNYSNLFKCRKKYSNNYRNVEYSLHYWKLTSIIVFKCCLIALKH